MRFAREAGDQLADDAHRRQDHDVDRRVGVEPEQVLEQHRIAAEFRIEDPQTEHPLERQQQNGRRQHGRPEYHDERRSVVRPHEQRQLEPGQPRSAHLVNRDQEVEPGQDRRETGDEDPDGGHHDGAVRIDARIGRVEGPAGVDPARSDGVERQGAARHEDVPTRQVETREGHVARPDHDRQQEVPQHGRDRRDQEEEDHHHAVHGEHAVVGLRLQQVALGRDQFHANHYREGPADQEEQRDRGQIEQANTLVVERQQPRLDAVGHVEIVLARRAERHSRNLAHGLPLLSPSALSVRR